MKRWKGYCAVVGLFMLATGYFMIQERNTYTYYSARYASLDTASLVAGTMGLALILFAILGLVWEK